MDDTHQISRLKFLQRQMELKVQGQYLILDFRTPALAAQFISQAYRLAMRQSEVTKEIGSISEILDQNIAVLIRNRVWIELPIKPLNATISVSYTHLTLPTIYSV